MKLSCGISSPCLAAGLDPNRIHRQIVGRDTGIKIYQICKKLFALHPLDIQFYCLLITNPTILAALLKAQLPTPILLRSSTPTSGGLEPQISFKTASLRMELCFLGFLEGSSPTTASPVTGGLSGVHLAQITVCAAHSSVIMKMHVAAAAVVGSLSQRNA